MDVPGWLEECFFQKVLQNSEKDETIEVSGITVKPATNKGDNYASDMYRINVTFSRIVDGRRTSEAKSLIAKLSPRGGVREEIVFEIADTGMFAVEISMMRETLPRMSQILQGKLDGISLAARCLHVQREKPTFLILEDLATKGFHMADRQKRLDLDQCLLTIRNLAVFHASSVALVEEDPEVARQYDKGMFHKDNYPMQIFFTTSARSLGIAASKWPELSPRIAEKILALSDVIYEKTCEVTTCREDDFNVINHGDVWVNNLLYCYDERGKLIEQTFVDFQLSYYGSPAVDLLYFFGTSPTDEIQMHHRKLILREYHTTLTEIMTKLECRTKAPSFDDLQKILKKHALYEVSTAVAILPYVLVDKSEVKSVNEIMKPDGRYEHPAYSCKLFQKVMTQFLQRYDSMGMLDL